MRVLVTGSSGFLGRHLVKALTRERGVSKVYGTSRGARRHAWDAEANPPYVLPFEEVFCDPESPLSCSTTLRRLRPDAVFHLAGVSVVREDAADPTAITRANVVATHNLLAACPRGCRFVYASSATVYGDQPGPTDETTPVRPASVYGATKAAGEALVQAYHALGKVRGLALRLVACAGAGATHGLVRDLVDKLLGPAPELELLGDAPGSSKPYLHAGDAARAFVRLGLGCDAGHAGHAVNVAPGDGLSVQSVAGEVMDALGVHKPIRWLGEGANWAGDNRLVSVCPARALRWGWQPAYPRSGDAVRRAALDVLAERQKEAA